MPSIRKPLLPEPKHKNRSDLMFKVCVAATKMRIENIGASHVINLIILLSITVKLSGMKRYVVSVTLYQKNAVNKCALNYFSNAKT